MASGRDENYAGILEPVCTGCLSELILRFKPRNPIKIVGNLPSETLAPALGFSLFAKEEEEKPMLNQWEADRPFF